VANVLYTLCQFGVVSPLKTLTLGRNPLKRCQICRVPVWVNEQVSIDPQLFRVRTALQFFDKAMRIARTKEIKMAARIEPRRPPCGAWIET